MSGRGIDQRVLIIDGSGLPAQVDASGNLQCDVNNSVSIDDSTPIDVNIISSTDEGHSVYAATVNSVDGNGNWATALATPGSGNKIRFLRWHVSQIPATSAAMTFGFRFAASSDTSTRYYLTSIPAATTETGVVVGRTVNLIGAANDKLWFYADTTPSCNLTVEYEEVS